MGNYLLQHKKTPATQQEKAKPEQVKNSAGGYVFKVTPLQQLERFLILGTEGGTYYVSQRSITNENLELLRNAVKEDGHAVLALVEDILTKNRAPKKTPSLVALAVCANAPDLKVRKAALEMVPRLCKTGTDLFQFVDAVNSERGWGRALKRAVADWYETKPLSRLEYQLLKYRQREGWSHRDVLRLAHPKADLKERNALYKFVTSKEEVVPTFDFPLIEGYLEAKTAEPKRVAQLVRSKGLTREMVPTEALQSDAVWGALLENMPLMATVRNLGVLTARGLLKNGKCATTDLVLKRIDEGVNNTNFHPVFYLNALRTYQAGQGERGKLRWAPVTRIVKALELAFYDSFKNIKPSNKAFYLGIDVSASMTWGRVAGTSLKPYEAAAVMAMVTARVEDNYVFRGFSGNMIDLKITARDSLPQAMNKLQNLKFGRTDCALPMLDALQRKETYDAFVVYTDNETWYGNVHPFKALKTYRKKMNPNAKLIVCALTATGFSIADPSDAGMLDVVGFDSNTPSVISAFV